jgi:uncharacterized repeat protein (TIGR01451 family)
VQSSVVQSVAVPSSGQYSFFVTPSSGTYTLLVSTTNTSTTPTPPTGWLAIQPSTAYSLVVGTNSFSDQNFGFYRGSAVRGNVFRDNGFGTGTPNDALQNGSELGISDIAVTASDGTNTRSGLTDVTGSYTLYLPFTFGATVTVSHTQAVPTGTNIVTTPILATAFNAPAARQRNLSFSAGQTYTINFGVVYPTNLSPDQAAQAQSPGTLTFNHLLKPGSQGSVSLALTAGSFSYLLRIDLNCDSDFDDPGELFVTPPLNFVVDATWPTLPDSSFQPCPLQLLVNIPAGLPDGRIDIAQLSSSLTWLNNPAISDSDRVFDTSTILSSGGLRLTKEVRNLSQSSPFALSTTAKPGETLEYKISYQNISTQPIFNIILSDPIPFFTSLIQDAYATGEVQLSCPNTTTNNVNLGTISIISLNLPTLCSLSTAPAPGGGTAPALLPGQAGSFVYRVLVK